MDYELMMNGNVKLGQKAPDFDAVTTFGNISLKDYIVHNKLYKNKHPKIMTLPQYVQLR